MVKPDNSGSTFVLLSLWVLSIVPAVIGAIPPTLSLLPLTIMFMASVLLDISSKNMRGEWEEDDTNPILGATLTSGARPFNESTSERTVRKEFIVEWGGGRCRSCGREMEVEETDPKGGFLIYEDERSALTFSSFCSDCSWTFDVLVDNGDVVNDVFSNEYVEE